jgi:hypothetical protein
VYNSCNYIRISDHKPVFSFFVIPTKIINQSAFEMVRKDILSEIDAHHNKTLPNIQLSHQSL